MGIYQENCDKYLAKGISVMPLRPRTKIPMTQQWQKFCFELPSEKQVAEWKSSTDDYNIGCCLGKQSRVIALDIDYADEATQTLIERLCPKTPYRRIGSKGCVLGFKFNGEKPFKIRTAENVTIVELLSTGNQMAIEGSIHPKTLRPYQSTAPLYEVIDQLPVLPNNFEEILRHALEEKIGKPLSQSGRTKVTEFIPAGARDTKMTSMAGIYALAVLRGEITLLEAIGMLRTWCENLTEKVVGDPINIESGISNLITFLFRHVNRDGKILPKGWDDGMTKEDKKKLGIEEDDENVEMSEEELREMIRKGFEKTIEGSRERNELVNTIVRKIAKSDMQTISEDRLIRFMTQSDRTLTVPALRRTIRELRSTGIDGLNHSEIARAALKDLNELYENPMEAMTKDASNDLYPCLRFVNDKFFKWNGAYWEELKEDDIIKHISDEYGSLIAAKRSSDIRGIIQVMKSLVGHELQTEKVVGINMANGFVLQDGTVLPHDRKYGATYCMRFSYQPELADLHDAPLFSTFLMSIWGQEPDFAERVLCLQEMFAAALFGLATKYARCFLFKGVAGAGKSQLLSIFENLFPPEAVSHVTPYKFAEKFSVTALSESRLNIAGELSEDSNIQGDLFKQITDGSVVEGQYKGRQVFNFRCIAAHVFASNYLPKSKDCSTGFSRRWAILSFNRVVPLEERIIDLGNKISAEESASIVAWAIDAIPKLIENKDYHLPPSHYEMVTAMREESDNFFQYMNSGTMSSPRLCAGESILISELYEKYSNCAYSELNTRPIGQRKFFSRLKELALTSRLFSVTMSSVLGLTLDPNKGEPLRF